MVDVGDKLADGQEQLRPNIVLILADDLGYSDIGCYGSEIETPNIDRLGYDGIRLSQMYNCARCCPSRASLLTGLYPHQAGIGHMVQNINIPAYQGFLNNESVTIAEALKQAGYNTYMSGKWHVGGNYERPRSEWAPGSHGYPLPMQRGFDDFFGTLTGAGSYFAPSTLMRGTTFVDAGDDPTWYYTDAIADEALRMITPSLADGSPFFLYLAFTAPHWPLQALPREIDKYRERYRPGWDTLRGERWERLHDYGLVSEQWRMSARDPDAWPWIETNSKDWETTRMAVYAAQVDRMDQAIGRVTEAIENAGALENTLIIFLSDNGGCAEFLKEDMYPDYVWPPSVPRQTRDGRSVYVGNTEEIIPGPEDTYASYDVCWANLSNTPFRKFKRWVHEGGIATPFIIHWPARQSWKGIVDGPAHIVDVLPTCLEAANAAYPSERDGRATLPLQGESLMSCLEGRNWRRAAPIYFEHEGNRAVRVNDWKLVSAGLGDWELYDMQGDRTELQNLATKNKTATSSLMREWFRWAQATGVEPDLFVDSSLADSGFVLIGPAAKHRFMGN